MATQQNWFVDFENLGDAGTDDPESIQPISDGESATETTLARPSENLRSRTEIVRGLLREGQYYRDFNHLVIEGATNHTIAWGGAVDAAGTGIITQTGALTLRPMLTPSSSKKGSLSVPSAGVNIVKYDVTATGYASRGQDSIFVEHRDVASAALTCTISLGPIKKILLIFDSTNVAHTTTAAVAVINAAIAADPDLGAGVGAPFLQASTAFPLAAPLSAQASTHIAGTLDQEAHVLSSGILTTLTTTTPLSNGDCVAIWYDKLVDEPPPALTPGGRWESNPDRGTSTIPLPSLVITSNDPGKIPGAVPICKVVNNELVWISGDRFQAGMAGPIGSVSGANVVVDSSGFSGSATNTNNGGIDNPLAPSVVQTALDKIDIRLSTLRTAWTVTDGTNSVGGHYDATSGIQDALTVLGAIGGTILVRRGTYTIPNTYAIPANVTFISDGLVTIQQAAPVSLSIGNSCRFYGDFTFNVGTIQITTGTNVHMDDATITGRLSCGTGFSARNLSVDGSGSAANYTVSMVGNNAQIDKLTVNHSLSVAGINNCVKLCNVTGTSASLASSCVRMSGVNGRIDTLTYVATSNLFAGVGLLEISGSDASVSHLLANTSAGAISSGRYGIWLNGCANATLSSIDLVMGSGTPLIIAGAVSVHGTNVKVSNTTGTDAVINTAGITGAQRWVWDRCVFSQNANTSSYLMDLIPDRTLANITFKSCRFEGAKLSGFMLRAQGAKFDHCTFIPINPTVAGAPRLGGVVNGQTETLFQFQADCVVDDCVLDGNDAEVNNNAGRPDISVPLFVEFNGATGKNLRMINMNTQMYSTVPYASILNMRLSSTLRGLTVLFTVTASVQGGAISLGSVVALNQGSGYFSDFTLPAFYVYPGNTNACSPFAVGPEGAAGVSSMIIERVRVLDEYKSVCVTDTASVLTLNRCVFVDCQFGTSTNGCNTAVGIPLPAGTSNRFTRCQFYHAGDVGSGVFTVLDGSPSGYVWEDCTYSNVLPEDEVVGVFSGTGANSVTSWRFVGCRFVILGVAVPGGPKPFHTNLTMAAASNVGAGNIFIYSTGTTTPPSFSAVVNIWS